MTMNLPSRIPRTVLRVPGALTQASVRVNLGMVVRPNVLQPGERTDSESVSGEAESDHLSRNEDHHGADQVSFPGKEWLVGAQGLEPWTR